MSLLDPITIQDADLGLLTFDRSFNCWEGKAVVGEDSFQTSCWIKPEALEEKIRAAYRKLFADLASIKMKAVEPIMDDIREWAASADLEEELTAERFAAALKLKNLSIEPDGDILLVFGETLGVFDGQAVMATFDADLNVSNAHIAG